jgi:hypothetical protein
LAPTLAAQTSLQRSKGMPLRGHVFDWPTAANRRADGGLKLAFPGSVSNDRPSMAGPACGGCSRPPTSSPKLASRVGAKASRTHGGRPLGKPPPPTRPTWQRPTPAKRPKHPAVGAHPVGDIFRRNAQALSYDTIDQGPNAARSGVCRERRRPQGGLLQERRGPVGGFVPRATRPAATATLPACRRSHHTPSVPRRALGAHPRGEFRRRGRRAGTAAEGGSGHGGPLV